MSAVPAPVPRNAPCPCGSGRKRKLCCGMTREAERALERQAGALLAAIELPVLFPLLRPDCKKFDGWADGVLARGFSPESLTARLFDDGLAALSRGEQERIARWVPESMPLAWRSLTCDASEEQLVVAILAAAVATGLNERLPLGEDVLELLEKDEQAASDPAEALALAIDPFDLWSPVEAQIAGAAVACLPDELDDELWDVLHDGVIAAQARHLASARHRKRLVRLVGYARSDLPVPDFPRASRALDEACAAFQQERALRTRLAAFLLGEAL